MPSYLTFNTAKCYSASIALGGHITHCTTSSVRPSVPASP